MDIKLSVIIPLFCSDEHVMHDRATLPLRCNDEQIEFIYVIGGEDVHASRVREELLIREENVTVESWPSGTGVYSLAKARNIGAMVARGSLLLLSDVDLFPHDHFYSNLLDFAEKRHLEDYENFFYPIPAVYLRPLSLEESLNNFASVTAHDDLLFGAESKLIENIHRVSSSLLISRSFYMTLGGQYEGFEGWGFEDWHFLWKLMMYPQPVPEPRDRGVFQASPPNGVGEYRSWRSAAEMLAEESFRANLFLYHAHHMERITGWKTRKEDNRRLFERLTSLKHGEVNYESQPTFKANSTAVNIYSRCPSVVNRLYFGPGKNLRVRSAGRLELDMGTTSGADAAINVLGGMKLTKVDLKAASYMIKKGFPFKFVCPTSLSSRNMMLDFDGKEFHPIEKEPSEKELVRLERESFMECGGMAYSVAADTFRHEAGLVGKQVILVSFSDQEIEEDTNSVFGLNDIDLRSVVLGLAPLFGNDTVFVVYDPISSAQTSPFENLVFISDRDIEMLYAACDLVVTQSPSDIWQSVMRNKPVATTGALLASLVPEVPILSSVVKLHEWIVSGGEPHGSEIYQGLLRKLVASTSRFILDSQQGEMQEALDRQGAQYRVMYEVVCHSLFETTYKFTWDSWERRLFHVVNPMLSRNQSMKFHREIVHDYRALSRREPGAAAQHSKVAPIKNPATSSAAATQPQSQRTPHAIAGLERIGVVKGGPGTFTRKLGKFQRDPYKYFEDSRYPIIRNLKYLCSN